MKVAFTDGPAPDFVAYVEGDETIEQAVLRVLLEHHPRRAELHAVLDPALKRFQCPLPGHAKRTTGGLP